MRIRVSGRSSDLSRIQIAQVSAAIRAAMPGAEVVPNFRESLGDKMLDDPLWAMPEKGVFTEDFVEDLREHRTDIVVHSWKDLPTEPRVGTRVVATLPRADVRDVLLVRRDLWSTVKPGATITILSSSPRRAHNLIPFLTSALPVHDLRLEFVPVRGNVPTRLRKLIEGEQHGLVVAKAALDRLLTSTIPEMQAMRDNVRAAIDRCRWMILPISENPTGAAQGALAMEIATDCDETISQLVMSLNDETTFAEATREREILRGYGGGCHQKIGVTVLSRPYGTLVSLRGLTDGGERLEHLEIERKPCSMVSVREVVSEERPEREHGVWVADEGALQRAQDDSLVWTDDLQSWRERASRGVWVNGSAEGLGAGEDPRADTMAGRAIPWVRLTDEEISCSESRGAATSISADSSDDMPPLRGLLNPPKSHHPPAR
jgi:hydroxymethylbilane synthase